MAIPKKGSRKIIVDTTEYRWIIRSKPTYNQGALEGNMTAATELSELPGSVLLIRFPWSRCDNWIENHGLSVTPREIEYCIKSALAKGWQPEKKGCAFDFEYKSTT